MQSASGEQSGESVRGLRKFVRDHPLVAAAAIGISALIVGAIIFQLILGGDEAPVRVRNGSIDLLLRDTTQVWKKTGNHWSISSGRRDHEDYVLKPSTAAGACSNTSGRKSVVRLNSSDNHWIELRAQGRHTKVTSDVALSISADGKTLSYPKADVYVFTVELDGSVSCAFKSTSELTWLDLED